MKKMKWLCLLLALMMGFSSAFAFEASDVSSTYNGIIKPFFETLGMDASMQNLAYQACRLTKDQSASQKYGVNVYMTDDKQVFIIEDGYIFAFADLSGVSALANIPVLILPFVLMESEDDCKNMFTWINTSDAPPEFKGTDYDAYEFIEPQVHSGVIIVKAGTDLNSLPQSLEELIKIAQELVY